MSRDRRFIVKSQIAVPAEELFAWHERPGAFERLMPPWDEVELVERSSGLAVGARTVVRIPMGPVKKTWVAEHTAYEKGRMFRDEQKSGPFAKWIHTHQMIPHHVGGSILQTRSTTDSRWARSASSLAQAPRARS